MIKMLISGFEPIYNLKKTPSGDIVNHFMSNGISIEGIQLDGIVLPQIFRQSAQILQTKIRSTNPEYVVMFGASEAAFDFKLEKIAINFEDTAIGDNSKIPIQDRTIDPNGPVAIACPLDLKLIKSKLDPLGIYSDISYSAGTHTCNSLYYEILSAYNKGIISAKPLFIHIPYPSSYTITEGFNNFRDISELARQVKIVLASIV